MERRGKRRSKDVQGMKGRKEVRIFKEWKGKKKKASPVKMFLRRK